VRSTATATRAIGATASATRAAATPGTSGKLPSPAPGVPDAYLTPPPPFRSVAEIPGRGATIAITKASQQPPPTPRAQNAWWQELEKRLGSTMNFTLVPLPQFTEKVTTLIAAGDLPDLLLISPLTSPDQYRAVQEGVFTDLTPFLSGDALRTYRNLAQYPAATWKNAALRGKLFGVPRLGLPFGQAFLYRQDWAEKVGPAQPKNADEFLALAAAMTKGDPDGNGKPDTWGLSAQGGDWSLGFIQGMFRVPNGWRKNADGTLTNAIETPEYRQALAFARRLYDAGVYHPDAATMNRSQATTALIGGKIGGYADQLTQLNGDIRTRSEAKRVNPAANVGALVPPGFDGGKGVTYNGTGFGSIAAIPAKLGRDPERVKELLRVLDYFSAPFGSEEYNFLTFGVEGAHHTLQPDGTRILNDRGRAEINELGTVVTPPRVFYFPSDPGDATYMQNAARDIAALGIDNPALTVFSPTSASKSLELSRLGIDRTTAIITGREPLTALDTYIKDWQSRGGEQIRQELQAALQGQ
jgi:putative aldouronate transport system substrate-binding protein